MSEKKKLSQSWCRCKEDKLALGEFIYKEDGKCECGIEMHHYHCESCGGVLQIG